MHIGSQITDLQPFEDAFKLLRELVETLRADGHAIDHVDVGGGLGIPYKDDNNPPPLPDAYAEIVKNQLRALDCKIVTEPGRLIVGNAGILVTEVIYVKDGGDKTFVIVDARDERPDPPDALRGLSRDPPGRASPPPTRRASRPMSSAPSARPATIWRSTARWPMPKPGDLIAVSSAGAYGAVQAGTYNTPPAGARSAGQGRRIPRHPPAPDLSRT